MGWDEQAVEIARAIGWMLIGHPLTNTVTRSHPLSNDRTWPRPYLARNHIIVGKIPP